MANKLVITKKTFGHIIGFIRAKQLLEAMRSLVTCLQDNFGDKQIEERIRIYKKHEKMLVS